MHRVGRGRGEGMDRGNSRMDDSCGYCEWAGIRAYDGEGVLGFKVEGAEGAVNVHVSERSIV